MSKVILPQEMIQSLSGSLAVMEEYERIFIEKLIRVLENYGINYLHLSYNSQFILESIYKNHIKERS